MRELLCVPYRRARRRSSLPGVTQNPDSFAARRAMRDPFRLCAYRMAAVTALEQLIRFNRAAQLAARQTRSRARSLRARMRAQRLVGRRIVVKSGELRSRLQAERRIARARV